MRIVKRLSIILILVVTAVASLFTLLQTEKIKSRLYAEMDQRAANLADSMTESLRSPLLSQSTKKIGDLISKFSGNKDIYGVAVFDKNGHAITASSSLHAFLQESPADVKTALATLAPQKSIKLVNETKVHSYVSPIFAEGEVLGALLLYHDTTFLHEQVKQIWHDNILKFAILAILLIISTLFVAHWTLVAPMKKTAEWVKKLRLNADDLDWKEAPNKELFGPLAREVRFLAQSLSEARAAAEEEAKLRLASESQWTPERLKEYVRSTLGDQQLFVVANREPYVHTRVGKEIRPIVPASGLVTAIEPILKACGGTWVGHGAGDADRDTVDDKDCVRVPPEDPQYTLRRVWMTKEEENGYYYGFSNEGLWPLCHIAHTRPTFRPEDWEYYKKINQKFADAALEEMKDTTEPCVLIQDYHFALLPRMIKKVRPDARVALFWHIPWPNPESFGICPWQREILDGMLGADLLGFHIQYHCNNFLETVDRAMESRIDWAQFSVSRGNQKTIVKPFPISVAIAQNGPASNAEEPSRNLREYISREYGINAEHMAVGVDRIDYTKGILERFRSVEAFLEKHREYQGKFTFVELGAPSRTLIETYHALDAEIESEVNRINWKFKNKDWKPIVLLKEHHSHKEIEKFYRTADICMVTSLHDGMNLVAKEYVATRTDRKGILILSRFAGAAQELRDALIVNPYDIEQMANAIYYALTMDVAEKRKRMARMQEIVRENNIYRWGADLITELAQIRIDQSQKTPTTKS